MKNLLKEYFLQSLASYPERDAIELQGQKYSYKAFYEIVSGLMAAIEKQNIKGKAIVVLNDHSVYSYASILAVQFSGNAFVPVDFSWPGSRLDDILRDVRAAAVFVSGKDQMKELVEKAPVTKKLIGIHVYSGESYGKPGNANETATYESISYILFTSGSTGNPKGVPVSHKNLSAFLKYNKDAYGFGENDRFLQVYELTFDVAYFSFFVPICVGACCCILQQHKSLPKFLSIINDLLHCDITVVSMVPTVINLSKKFIKNKAAATVKHCFFIGDVLYHSEAGIWQGFMPNGIIHNYYGPTEVTIACSDYEWSGDVYSEGLPGDSVPIGKLFAGLKYKIVNEQGYDVPQGETGELLISGAQVVDGYINKVHEEKFLSVSEEENSDVYYKTGDLVLQNNNGDLVFIGRVDYQVKLNGYRIELHEVRLAVSKATERKVVVIKKKGLDGFYFLRAIIEGNKLEEDELKEQLGKVLPGYMIPSEFVFVPGIPLTESGKIDIRSLQNG